MSLLRIDKKSLFLLLLISGWLWILPAPLAAQQQADDGITLGVSAGYDGFYKSEYGVPVKINVANSGPAVSGELRITLNENSQTDRLVYNAMVELPTQSNKQIRLYVHLPGFSSALEVELLSEDGQPVAQATSDRLSAVAANQLLYGIVSPEPGEFSFLEGVVGSRTDASVAFLRVDDLPDLAAAWDALDVVVFNDIDSSQLTAGQLDAMKGWLSLGGQLVVTGGPGWQKTNAGLAALLPVAVDGTEPVADLPALSEFAGVPFRDSGPYLLTNSSLRAGELLVHQDGMPLLARQPFGRGSVYFLALDPTLAPLLDWDGSEALWLEVVGRIPTLPVWASPIVNGYAASEAVTSLPSLAMPSAFQLILFLLVYVIAIGPVNYLVLKRMNRRQLAWVTVPALVLIFSVAAYFTGFQLKGNNTIINQISVSYGEIGAEQLKVQSLVGLYSPKRQRFDLNFPGNTLAHPFEQGYGQMSGNGTIDAISRGRQLTMSGVRVDVSGMETFVAESYQANIPVTVKATLSASGADVVLTADIQNNSSLTLEDAALLFGSDIIAIGALGPGESVSRREVVGAGSTVGTGSAVSVGPIYMPGPTYGAPLSYHAETLLGTADYYNDREAYPRWQLLQALESDGGMGPRGMGSGTEQAAQHTVTLVAWTDQPQLELDLSGDEFRAVNSTLYFLEAPLTQQLLSGSDISIPITLLDWTNVAENGTYQASISNLYLQGGWAAFEYKPWPSLQEIRISSMAVSLEPQIEASPQPAPPKVMAWNWDTELWEQLEDANWGVTEIRNPERYLGLNHAIRLRVEDNLGYGVEIREIYPIYTGSLP